jgi:MFS family permease
LKATILISILRLVFSNRNIVVLSISGVFAWIFDVLLMGWWPLYLLELGATETIVGFAAAIQSASRILFQIPGGILADRLGRKKILVYGTAMRIFAPIICIYAQTWQQFIPAIIIYSSSVSIYGTASTALVAESLPKERRGAAFGAYRMIISIPPVLMPIISGYIIDQIGLVKALRIFFYLCPIGYILVTIIRAKYVKETLRPSKESDSLREDFSVFFSLKRIIIVMLIVESIFSFSIQMAFPFLAIYAVEIAKFTKTQWGTLQAIPGIIGIILSLPGGMLSDKYGRSPLIFLAQILVSSINFYLILFRDFNKMLFAYFVTGIGVGLCGGGGVGMYMRGPVWNALVSDLVPSKDRAKILGLMTVFSGIGSIPSSIAGGYMWFAISPESVLISSSLIGFLSAIIFRFFVKEPITKER